MNKRRNKWATAAVPGLLLLAMTTAACGGGNNGNNANAGGNGDKNASNAAANQTANNGAADAPTVDPNAKYDPPIEVTTVRYTDSSFKFKDGESLDNNAWTKAYESELGIKVKNKWVVNGEGNQYNQKINLTITSGDLPDMFMVDAKQFRDLAEAGKLEDLTALVDQYGSPLTKEMIDRGVNAKAAASYDGKLYAIPPAEDYFGGAPLLWVRADWMKKLSLPEPKTMDDFVKIAEAFTKQDPDGNGKPDTYGLAASKDVISGYPDLSGFMNGFHAYMNIWVKDASGKLVNGNVQPEMKTALAKLQELYKDGVIDKEFGIKDGGKAAELQTAGKVGMNFGAMWNPLWPLQDGVTKDPNAEWTPYPIPSVDGTPAKAQSSADFNAFWVVKKGAAHPEAIVKLFNFYNEKIVGESAEPAVYHTDNGIEVFKYALMAGGFGTPQGLLTVHKNVMDALSAGDAAKLTPEEKSYFDKIKLFQGGDRTNWGTNKVFGENGSWAVIGASYSDGGLLMKNEFFGPPTPGMTEKRAILDKLVLESFTKIILGAPIGDFDKFVENWNKLGGEQITQEVNDWYGSK
ncbi:extracellular solute-binding protein [Paenibacillus sacheonensis]|uniref:Extracellular solute-binding protein n=1 Tax=Paenibacillus sacheonensis TaxID=742054 RepID=A0A7X5BZB1_9BACL|nr:extracellular solute-binding protein [Paenibacillus sacheonensis]MBM7564903.1 putative aldouronate transport system substrate-binding protein [Paenibacillus sacheonensis]NBC70306.1 extracellular solute-binding protein [Paenibacillus sacheonensis]